MPSLFRSALFLLALSAHCDGLYSPGLPAAPRPGRWWLRHRRPRAVTQPRPPGLLAGPEGRPRVELHEGGRAAGDDGESSGNGGEAAAGRPAATTPETGRALRPTSPLFGRPTESDDHTPPGDDTGARNSHTGGHRNSGREGSNSTGGGGETGGSWARPLACAAMPAFVFLLLWGLFNFAVFARRRPAAAADRLRSFAAAANAFLLAFAGLRVALTALVLSSPELRRLIAGSLPPLRDGSAAFPAAITAAAAGFASLVAAVSLHELALPCLAAAFAAQLLHFVPAAAARKPRPLPPSLSSSSSSLSLISSSPPSPASGRARGALLAAVSSAHLCVVGLACLAFAARPATAAFMVAVPRGFLVAWGLALAGVCLAAAARGPGAGDRRRAPAPAGACFAGSAALLALACCLHGAEAALAVLGFGAARGAGPPLLAARLTCELCAALALCATSSLWLRHRLRDGAAAAAEGARKRRAGRDGGRAAPSKRADGKSDGKRSASYDSVRPALAGEAREPVPSSPRRVADGDTLGSAVRFSVGDERLQLLQGNGEEEADNGVDGVNLSIIPVDRNSSGSSGASRAYDRCDAGPPAAIGSEDGNQSSLREFTQRSRFGEVPSGPFRPGGFIPAANVLSWDDFIRPPSPINLQGSIDDALWRRSLIVRSLFEEDEDEEDVGGVQKEGEDG